jgi:histidinol dehydrogenase
MKLVVGSAEPRFARVLKHLLARGMAQDSSVESAVRDILDNVRSRGDRALLDYSKRFDDVKMRAADLVIGPEEMAAAAKRLPARQRKALRLAARRIRDFHSHQVEKSFRYTDKAGVSLGQEIRPVERAGLYVPGGEAFYPSSVLMNAVPASVAGVDEIIAVTPPHAGGEPDMLLAAAHIAGVHKIIRAGGAQAIGALAFGTRTVPKVDKIVGPGNRWVATAKRLVSGVVSIDMVAGPSEVLVIADASANPEHVAADLLAQAEHGPDSTAICLTTSRRLAEKIESEVLSQLEQLPRAEFARQSMRDNGAIVVTRSLKESIALANEIAPEHLELAVRDAEKLVREIRHAGAIFVGHYSPEAFGDYLAGPNHVLPTGGTARFSSPLGVYDFTKRTGVIHAPQSALQALGETVVELAEMEGLTAHGAAVARRIR